jgi:hypothetical protein
MATVRAMSVLQGHSGLSRDVFVNTFYFVGAGTASEDQALAASAIAAFWEQVEGTQTNPMGAYISAWVDRAACSIKTYDMAETKPRVPTTWPLVIPAPLTTQGMMEEAAVCLSYHGSVPPVSPRRRGRIYIGPLGTSAVEFATATTRPVPKALFCSDLLVAAKSLVDTPLIQWSIRSTRPAENYVAIVGGYCDDAFDTQRRRGTDPLERTPFIAAV